MPVLLDEAEVESALELELALATVDVVVEPSAFVVMVMMEPSGSYSVTVVACVDDVPDVPDASLSVLLPACCELGEGKVPLVIAV